jgi:hypothetical protein
MGNCTGGTGCCQECDEEDVYRHLSPRRLRRLVRRPSHNIIANGKKLATGETVAPLQQDEEIRAVARSEYWLVRWRESQKEPRGWRLSLPDGSAPRGGQSTYKACVNILAEVYGGVGSRMLFLGLVGGVRRHRRKSQRRCRRGQCC